MVGYSRLKTDFPSQIPHTFFFGCNRQELTLYGLLCVSLVVRGEVKNQD